jgi:hypothetical protein
VDCLREESIPRAILIPEAEKNRFSEGGIDTPGDTYSGDVAGDVSDNLIGLFAMPGLANLYRPGYREESILPGFRNKYRPGYREESILPGFRNKYRPGYRFLPRRIDSLSEESIL